MGLNRHPDLLAYWPLHGSFNDFSGNGRHLTSTGVVFVDDPSGGGRCARFDGIDDYLYCAGTGLPSATNPGDLTIIMRVRNIGIAGHTGYVNFGLTNGQCLNIFGANNVASQLDIIVSNKSSSYQVSLKRLKDSLPAWLMISLRLETGVNINTAPAAQVAVDGVSEACSSAAFQVIPPDTEEFRLGGYWNPGPNFLFRGDMSEVSLWRRRLNAAQARAIMAGGNPKI